MKQSLNVAIFGLSPNQTEEIKQKVIWVLPDSVSVKWCSIAEKKIDLLLVNDVFFSSSTIQNIILKDVFAYLRLEKMQERGGQILGDFLYYPIGRTNDLVHWIQHTYFDNEDSGYPYEAHSPPSSAGDALGTVRLVLEEVFRDRNGFIQLMGKHGCFALVDARTERIWLNDENALIHFDSNLNQMYATSKFVQEFIKDRHVKDLRMWLWPVLKQSGLNFEKVEHHHYFKLNIWPQFEKGFERRNLLKIAACFAQGAKIADVQKYLDLTDEIVEHFVSIALLMNLGEIIDAKSATFSLSLLESENNPSHAIKGFFGRLRKKLGL